MAMKRPRGRTWAKWGRVGCTLASLVVFGAWIGSWWVAVYWVNGRPSHLMNVELGRGVLAVEWYVPDPARLHYKSTPNRFEAEWLPPEYRYQAHWLPFRSHNTRAVRTEVPLWMPLVALLVPTAWLWRGEIRRRVPPLTCGGCGYDRRGLPADAVCPECGKP